MPRSIDKMEKTSAAPAPQPPALEKMPFLLVLAGPHMGELHKLKADQPTVIGRGEADLRIEDDGVSRRHCS
ncbi:MAG: FHA domain-containing protein, partial [Myxococcales bacterium]|nr:FHA domain-containing protein [Myxococcales bacterium]